MSNLGLRQSASFQNTSTSNSKLSRLFFGGTVALHEDRTQDKYQDAGLGCALFTMQHRIICEPQLDEDIIAAVDAVYFVHIKAKDHLPVLRGSQEDLRGLHTLR